MAEISYPFNTDSAGGGSKLVSQVQWQVIAKMWGGDRVDFTLTNTSYSASGLPFAASVVNGRQVQVQPGNAWVGGFYYSLTASKTVDIAANTTSMTRLDLVVIRVDMTAGSANLAVLQGSPSANPAAPALRRQPGGIWEMALYVAVAGPNNTAVTVSSRMPFNQPEAVNVPWNAESTLDYLPHGTFLVDMDSNGESAQHEWYKGRDGLVHSRTLGKSFTYTPGLVDCTYGTTSPATRTGRWRWIAPNVYHFSVRIDNPGSVSGQVTSGNWRVGFTLPFSANTHGSQVCHGMVSNPKEGLIYPNYYSVTGITSGSAMYLHTPGTSGTSQGLDGLRGYPTGSTFYMSGIIEANEIAA